MPTSYQPDRVSHPGATLLELLESLHMSQAELAERTGRPKKLINEIIKGKTAITPSTAVQLEAVLGVSASFWNNRESRYQEFLARQENDQELVKFLDWTENFPVSSMRTFGWLEAKEGKAQILQSLLQFFGVVSPNQWIRLWGEKSAAFRRSPAFASDWFATAAWLRKGELDANNIDCEEYSAPKFRQVLLEARKLTVVSPNQALTRLRDLCKKVGVAVVFVPELPKTRVSGATQWISPSKALIYLSSRYRTDDHLWFTFFHEACHVLMHGKKDLFVDGEQGNSSAQEKEADEFSRDWLIPQVAYDAFLKIGGINAHKIRVFSEQIGISPGIVVGRLQRDQVLNRNLLNGLKARVGDLHA